MGRMIRIFLLAALAVVSVACGGGGSSGSTPSAALASGDVAVVASTHITRTQLNHAITLRVKAMQQAQNQPAPPKPGTTAYTDQVVQPTLQHLVQGAEVRNIAQDLGVTATSGDVDKAIQNAITQYYGGDRSRYEADVKKYGLTDDDVRYEFTTTLLESKIQAKLQGQVKVTDQDVKDYYDHNKASYKSTSDTRVVDYGLYPDKASAQSALKKLAGGASFKDVSSGTLDTSANHEPFTAQKGQIDTAF